MTKIGTYLLKYLVRKVSFDIKTGHKPDSVKLLRHSMTRFCKIHQVKPKKFDCKARYIHTYINIFL